MSIFIVSHSHMVRDILRTACKQQNIDIADVCPSSRALKILSGEDLVVLHTGRAMDDIIDQVGHLSALRPVPRIMLISPDAVMDAVRKTFDGTVDAILTENNPTETLVGAIAVVNKGYCLVPGPLGAPEKRTAASSAPSPKIKVKWAGTLLSPRECAVLEKLRDGGSNKDIANALGICEATVKVYLRTCFKKIGVKNRTQAAVWAAERL